MAEKRVLDAACIGTLLQALRDQGWKLAGPRVRDGAIVYDEITGPADLPAGWTDEQAPGKYRLRERGDGALFGYAVGPHSWKKYLFPPSQRLWTASRSGARVQVAQEESDFAATAFIGVRACELAAIAIQDKVFLGGERLDPHYQARRDKVFIVAVQCGVAGGNCFCVSMNTGPRASGGYDIALTEILEDGHRFLAAAGSDRGAAILRCAGLQLGSRAATPADESRADAVIERTSRSMGRSIDTGGLPGLLQRNLEHKRWDELAARCLACSNCTLVCPTCFCSSQEDVPNLAHTQAERWRRWDSCFTADFSYLHGGSVRSTIRSRYRQWLTHKLSSWHEQFGSSGCVGCGRCISWCPVGIDFTEEIRAIRAAKETAETDTRSAPIGDHS